jgi:signal transduction histidine kinase
MAATATTGVSASPDAVGVLRLNMLPVVFPSDVQKDVVYSLPYTDELWAETKEKARGGRVFHSYRHNGRIYYWAHSGEQIRDAIDLTEATTHLASTLASAIIAFAVREAVVDRLIDHLEFERVGRTIEGQVRLFRRRVNLAANALSDLATAAGKTIGPETGMFPYIAVQAIPFGDRDHPGQVALVLDAGHVNRLDIPLVELARAGIDLNGIPVIWDHAEDCHCGFESLRGFAGQVSGGDPSTKLTVAVAGEEREVSSACLRPRVSGHELDRYFTDFFNDDGNVERLIRDKVVAFHDPQAQWRMLEETRKNISPITIFSATQVTLGEPVTADSTSNYGVTLLPSLPEPTLNFRYGTPTLFQNAAVGLLKHGPYDSSSTSRMSKVKALILHPDAFKADGERLRKALVTGVPGSYGFPGLAERYDLEDLTVELRSFSGASANDYSEAAHEASRPAFDGSRPDVCFVITQRSDRYAPRGQNPYMAAKAAIVNADIAAQGVTIDVLRQPDEMFRWSIQSIALQVYAKIGNVPYVLHDPDGTAELVLGIGRHDIHLPGEGYQRQMFGAAAAFRQDGDLLVADFSTPWGTVLGQTIGNTLEVLVAAVLFMRLAGRGAHFERVRDVLALIISAAVGTLISASFGALSLRLGHVITAGQLGTVFRTWWLSDFSGVLVVAPLGLVWISRHPWRLPWPRAAEAALLLATLVVLTEVPSQEDVPYIVFPVLIWAALRFGPIGAATTVAIASGLTVWNTAQGSGPFVRASITHSLLATQLFVSVAALTSLVLAAVTAERSTSEKAQRQLAAEQAALRRIATLVAGDTKPDRVFEEVTTEAAQTLGANAASLARFDPGNTVTFIGAWSDTGELAFPAGSSITLDGSGVIAAVRRTGEPQLVQSYDQLGSPIVERMTAFGYGSAAAAPIKLGGDVWGALVAAARRGTPLPPGAERRLADFAELVAQALANADAYRKLAESRARIVEVADGERRRLERNLHDGAQQRLVSVALQLRLAKNAIGKDGGAAASLLTEADDELGHALEELRELARGIHPAALTTHGLATALAGLTERAPVPVQVTRSPSERLPEAVEAAIYYLVAEAITNVAKYAQATHASVAVDRAESDACVTVVVEDDGVGGADPGKGTGLVGLADRIEALGGRLDIDSPPGRGTRLTAQIPFD